MIVIIIKEIISIRRLLKFFTRLLSVNWVGVLGGGVGGGGAGRGGVGGESKKKRLMFLFHI